MSDRASKALAEASLPGESRTYHATSKRSGVPLTTLVINGGARKKRRPKANPNQLTGVSYHYSQQTSFPTWPVPKCREPKV
jgi:hypothetical protein